VDHLFWLVCRCVPVVGTGGTNVPPVTTALSLSCTLVAVYYIHNTFHASLALWTNFPGRETLPACRGLLKCAVQHFLILVAEIIRNRLDLATRDSCRPSLGVSCTHHPSNGHHGIADAEGTTRLSERARSLDEWAP
jgi:hypothetical protein